jgi:hypothetical protein
MQIIEATIQSDGRGYFLNPNFAVHEDTTLDEWLEQGEQNGYTVTVNTELDGLVQGQDGGTVYHCELDAETFLDVVVWEVSINTDPAL